MSILTTAAAHESVKRDDGFAQSTMRDLPEELLLQILSDATVKGSGVMLLSDTGDEYELLIGEGKSSSLVCRRLLRAVQAIGTSKADWLALPKTHVYKGANFKYFFDLSSAGVQSRINLIADEYERKHVTVLSRKMGFYPHGWGLDRYEAFINSPKNEIDVLVLPTAHSSKAGISVEDDKAFAFRVADSTCIGLREVIYWAMMKGEDGRLLPNLRRIVVPDGGTWESSVGENDFEAVDLRTSESWLYATPTDQIQSTADDLAFELNQHRVRGGRRPNRPIVIVSNKLIDSPDIEYDSDNSSDFSTMMSRAMNKRLLR